MGFSEIPPPPTEVPGQDPPAIQTRPPGPQSRTWLTRATTFGAPMGPVRKEARRGGIKADVPGGTVVFSTAEGCNVLDVDGNRYVDLAAGFGSLPLGHRHPRIAMALEVQMGRLLQALGDVHPSEPKIALMERLARLYEGATGRPGRVILGQSGADAVSAALKSAVLHTGRPGIVAFDGAYHGLSYGPLAACGLRASYSAPFSEQLNGRVRFLPFPEEAHPEVADEVLERLRFVLTGGDVGAVLLEPIQGRGGVLVPPPGFVAELARITRSHGAVLIADEIWTGLGRSGAMIHSGAVEPDIVCLGKGLGGGVPISACVGAADIMNAWRQDDEVVHTATFAGAPLACCTALATLDVLSREKLAERAGRVGAAFKETLARRLAPFGMRVRGEGLMVGVDLTPEAGSVDGPSPARAVTVCQRLLERGYLASTGGGQRDVLVLTPPLIIEDHLLEGFANALEEVLSLP